MTDILFIHGFASSGAYKMADMLRQLLHPDHLLAPDLPLPAAEALSLLQDIIQQYRPGLVVGLSWGGFLAQKLYGQRKVLVNPDLHVSRFLRMHLGDNAYLSPRRDGQTRFTVTEDICREYEILEKTQYQRIDKDEQLRTLGCFADRDELVRCADEFAAYYPGRLFSYPGGHLPSYRQMKQDIVPAIRKFLEECS